MHDRLHRLVKEALDSGAASSVAEAEAMFREFRLALSIGAREASDCAHQATLLTAVALGRRVFHGGVFVSGDLDVPLLVPAPLGATLRDAVFALGGKLAEPSGGLPVISIGGPPVAPASAFHIRTIVDGWRGGIVCAADPVCSATGATAISAVLAAGIAVNEAFLHARGAEPRAGRRAVGLSLWNPAPTVNWLAPESDGPSVRYLPSRLWLIGLGHLGQAYLWTLSLLSYPGDGALSLVLQDVDDITPSTESTSILTSADLVGTKKTRAMAAWAERRGFATAIHERLFDDQLRRQPQEPRIALCGLDNALGRQALDRVGFDFIVEAGLGRGHQDFRAMRLHTLPGARSAADLWSHGQDRQDHGVGERDAYKKMLCDGSLDQCGVTLLAGKAVGAPFVGAVAASLAIAETLRLLHQGPLHQVIDLDLQAVEHRTAVPHRGDFSRLNPGFVAI